jgi:hypothetical protein
MRLSVIYLLFFNLATSSADVVRVKLTKIDNLIKAVIHVESRGDSMAYNSKEDAVGVLQIRPIMVREVNRLLGFDKYTLKDRWSVGKSKEMFNIVRQNTKDATDEKVARRWNGGGNGHKKKSTLGYWDRVKEQLKTMEKKVIRFEVEFIILYGV